jgi:hypothetical protein
MLTDARKDRILNELQKFEDGSSVYASLESQIDETNKTIQIKKEQLSKMAQEEHVREIAEEVLFPSEQKGPSQSSKIEDEIKGLESNMALSQDKLSKLRGQLTHSMYNLPIPVDLDKYKQDGDKIVFFYFDGIKLGSNSLSVMQKLLKMNKLEFQGVGLFSDRVTVESSSAQNGIGKLASGIKAYRLKLAEILKAYEQIDAMVERAAKSSLYPQILRLLLVEKKMATSDLAKRLNQNERKVYDSCYNLTREAWAPSPLEYTQGGEWRLTISGEILVNRLIEKYPESAKNLSSSITIQ